MIKIITDLNKLTTATMLKILLDDLSSKESVIFFHEIEHENNLAIQL